MPGLNGRADAINVWWLGYCTLAFIYAYNWVCTEIQNVHNVCPMQIIILRWIDAFSFSCMDFRWPLGLLHFIPCDSLIPSLPVLTIRCDQDKELESLSHFSGQGERDREEDESQGAGFVQCRLFSWILFSWHSNNNNKKTITVQYTLAGGQKFLDQNL